MDQEDTLEILLVGTAPAFGIPNLYCDCRACVSRDPKDTRVEAGVLIKRGDTRMMVDAGRGIYRALIEQEYLPGVDHIPIDGIAVTHSHFDHWGGIDELANMYRRYQRERGIKPEENKPLKIYTKEETWKDSIEKLWGFLTQSSRGGTRPPMLDYKRCEPGKEEVHDNIHFTPYAVKHGPKGQLVGCLSYLITLGQEKKKKVLITGDLAPHKYWTDWEKDLPFTQEDKLDLVIIEANSWQPLPRTGHLSLLEALDMIEYWQPQRAILTHISHEYKMTHAEIEVALKGEFQRRPGLSSVRIELAYDGMRISC